MKYIVKPWKENYVTRWIDKNTWNKLLEKNHALQNLHMWNIWGIQNNVDETRDCYTIENRDCQLILITQRSTKNM